VVSGSRRRTPAARRDSARTPFGVGWRRHRVGGGRGREGGEKERKKKGRGAQMGRHGGGCRASLGSSLCAVAYKGEEEVEELEGLYANISGMLTSYSFDC
jgi:hypothetical protein